MVRAFGGYMHASRSKITFITLNNHVFALSTTMFNLSWNIHFMNVYLVRESAQNSIKVRKTAIKTTMQTNTFRLKVSKGFYLFNLCTHRLSYEIWLWKNERNAKMAHFKRFIWICTFDCLFCFIRVLVNCARAYRNHLLSSILYYFRLFCIIFVIGAEFHFVNKNRFQSIIIAYKTTFNA